MKGILNTDGGARGNPGPAGIGVVLRTEDGEILAEIAKGIGWATNNVAEYEALIVGLELAHEHGITEIEIQVDSELVMNQMSGNWKIKNERLRSLAVKARSLVERFDSAEIKHVRRAHNTRADRLANAGMDEAMEEGLVGPDQQNLLE
ncbi:MAG TPA: ribonuclease HI family protein [Actinomycetota bacterium]|jgi:ribonuclease HI|nr:ribonuclease HI family protein [Actinomycetota bacterium]